MQILKTLVGTVMALVVSGVVVAADSTHGAFTYSKSKDAFTDEDRSFIYTSSTSSRRKSASIAWRCLEDGLNVFYLFDSYMSGDSDKDVLVRYRIDDLSPSGQEFWGLAQEQKGAFMPMNEVAEFTNVARAGSKIVFEVVDPMDGERLQDTFSLYGLTAALTKLPCAK